MSNDCNPKNPLRRDGSSQAGRLLQSLLPGYVKPDERELPDLVNFAARFAEEVRYFNLENEEEGDWKAFIENDISTLICIVLNRDLKPLQAKFNDLVAELRTPSGYSEAGFEELMDLLYQLVRECDNWLSRAAGEGGFRSVILNGIRPRLREALVSLIGIEKAAGQELGFFARHHYSSLHDDWQLSYLGLPATENDIPADTDAVNPGGTLTTDAAKVAYLVDPDADADTPASPLQRIFKAFYEEMGRMVSKAPVYLEASLENFPQHEPHAALFLTFLQLLRYQRESLNDFTQKHLDFYYRDILGLQEKPSQPDQVYLLFELARTTAQYMLPAGTRFAAGKDQTGVPLHYQLDQDTVLNKAAVADIRTLFLDKIYQLNPANCQPANRILNVLAAPVANSKDGLGTALDGPEPKWETLGAEQVRKHPENHSMVPARLGFAISSPIFWLREGRRTVTLTLAFENPSYTDNFLNPILLASQGFGSSAQILALGTTLAKALKIEFTGAEGWVNPGSVSVKVNRDRQGNVLSDALTFELVFGPDKDAISNYDAEIHGEDYAAEWPLARIFLDTGNYGHLYHYFKELRLVRADLHVGVKSLTNVAVQNDQGPMEASKPFMPFGAQPVAGSSFYLGNAEIFSKKLSQLNLNISWLDAPGNMAQHYAQYPLIPKPCDTNPARDNEFFTARVLVLDDFFWRDLDLVTYKRSPSSKPASPALSAGGFVPIKYESSKAFDYPELKMKLGKLPASPIGGSSTNSGSGSNAPVVNYPAGKIAGCGTFDGAKGEPLFATFNPTSSGLNSPSDARSPKSVLIPGNKINMGRTPELRKIDKYNPNTRRGYLKLELNAPDFQHKNYTQLYTEAIIDMAKTTPTGLEVPEEPYTPTIKTISIDYESEQSVDLRNVASPDFYLHNDYERFYHIGPFGQAALLPVASDLVATDKSYDPDPAALRTDSLFPQFRMSDQSAGNASYGTWSEGNLFIGMSGVKSPQQVSLLFQMAEGTGSVDHPLPAVKWSYLAQNTWQEFSEQQIVADTTLGLSGSGIVTLSLPSAAGDNNSILPAGLHWIRASVPDNTPAVPWTIEIKAQAAQATFVDKNNDPQHLARPLPAGTIQKLSPKDFSVKGLEQPFASFGGKMKEQDERFYQRVSERLRHKGRAITIWDYEHLVLEEFTEVYKVRCLNHTNSVSEVAPGNVRILVIPNLQNQKAINPLQPRTSVATLERIRHFLNKIISPFINLEVANPRYEQIKLKFAVHFKPGFDPGFYKTLLQQDILRYLSPWAYEETSGISFGGEVLRSVLLDFVEERPYVEFLTDFQLFHIVNGISSGDVGEAKPQSSGSILVSSRVHDITTI